eukprot:3726252-Ditylum_brightwellii.AAC.1
MVGQIGVKGLRTDGKYVTKVGLLYVWGEWAQNMRRCWDWHCADKGHLLVCHRALWERSRFGDVYRLVFPYTE